MALFVLLVLVAAVLLRVTFGGHRRAGGGAGAPEPDLPPADLPETQGRVSTWPLVVGSASQVEPRAARERCARCGSELKIEAHEAAILGGRRLRVVHMHCRQCGLQQPVWFTLAEPLPDA